MTEPTERPPPLKAPSDDVDMRRDPNVSFWQKWDNHVTHKKTTGIIRHAPFANRWAPRVFYFACTGGTGWIAVGSIPYFYGDDDLWMFVMEFFTIYVFIQVIINYFLTKNTDSSYQHNTTSNNDHHSQINHDIPSAHDQQFMPQPLSTSEEQINQFSGSSSSSSPSSSFSSYRMLVATSVNGSNIERKSFPYWSWVPCVSCDRPRPPRCHHCTLCETCILKRDHHCYFTRVCIGVNNQQFYMYFLFWCVLLTWLGSLQLVPYLLRVVLTQYSYWNILVPFNLYNAVTGNLPLLYLHLILVVWAVIALTFISTGMFSNGLYLMIRGVTTFENDHRIKILDTRSFAGRLRSVFGRNWAVNLLLSRLVSRGIEQFLPDYLKTSKPVEDAVNWPSIKTA